MRNRLFKATKKVRFPSEGPPELSFKLYTSIEPNTVGGKIISYTYMFERFELNSKGKKIIPDENTKSNRIFDYPGYTEEEIGLDKRPALEILKELNDQTLFEIDKIRKRFKGQGNRIQNKKTTKQINFLNLVLKYFEDWYNENSLKVNYKTIKEKRFTPLQEFINDKLMAKGIKKGVTIPNRIFENIRIAAVKEGISKAKTLDTIRKIAYRTLGYGDSYNRKSLQAKIPIDIAIPNNKTKSDENSSEIEKAILQD